MKKSRGAASLLAALALGLGGGVGLAACGGDDESASEDSTAPALEPGDEATLTFDEESGEYLPAE